ncbi:MAG: response regulator [Verrucomicrobiae bacterium]|nr:response regulator [Verrucomicrobiae bacterium]
MNKHTLEGKRVLIVEDNELFSRLVFELLKEEKMEPFTATDLTEAFKIMEKTSIDLIFLDIRLQNENGLDILPDFKKKYPEVPVVVLTGMGYDSNMMKTAIDRGAATYFSKENDLRDLLGLADRLISKHWYFDERSLPKASKKHPH